MLVRVGTRATFAKESPNDVTKNYGFLFVQFYGYAAAAAASERARTEFRMGFVYAASPTTMPPMTWSRAESWSVR